MVQHLRRGVAHDQVEGVVDVRLAIGAPVVIGNGRAQRLTFLLGGERNHRGGATARGGTGSGVEIVGHAHGRLHRLVEVAMRVHAARRDDATGGINLAHPLRQQCTNLDNAPARNAQVGHIGVTGRRHARIADDQVQGFRHACASEPENDVSSNFSVDNIVDRKKLFFIVARVVYAIRMPEFGTVLVLFVEI